MIRKSLIAMLLASTFAHAALSQEVMLYRAGETVDAYAVAHILGRQSALPQPDATPDGEEPIRTRSIRMLPAAAAVGAARADSFARAGTDNVERAAPRVRASEPAGPSALALPVQFAFNSADILPPARGQLDALAAGIKLLEPGQRVVIEGHTDAAGSEEYNLQLSQRRAMSVKRYLVMVHGIDESRLQAVGFGKYHPLEGHDPYDIENRRVQFHGA